MLSDLHSIFIGMAGLIAKRRDALKDRAPVLVLEAGDYSMGTTLGNQEFDLGPEGLGSPATQWAGRH